VNILQAYEKSTVSPKPRFREEKNSLYSFDYNRCTDFCKHFFKDFQFFQDFFYFSAILALYGAITPPLWSARAA